MTSNSVYEAVSASAARHPDRPILEVMPGTAHVYDIPAGAITYAQFMTDADKWADRLMQAGYGPGMRVAVLLENRPQYFVIFVALNKLGISIVPINPDLRAAELEYLFGHSEPCLIVALPDRLSLLTDAIKAAGLDAQAVGPDDPLPAPRPDAAIARPAEIADREAAILYTSGTTGDPKGCVLPNTYFLVCGSWYISQGGLMALSEDTPERMITPLPIFHMNAMACSFMAMVMCGGCLIALDRFHPYTWWSDVAASRATCLHYLGILPSILMQRTPSPEESANCVRFGFGAGVDPELHEPFESRFGFPLVEAWAMTETGNGGVVAASRKSGRLVGVSCLGKFEGTVEARVIGEDGKDVPTDMPGELLVRTAGADPRHGFFAYYEKNPEATAEAWADGWFHTGDLVRRDAENRVYFVDRKKNVIRRSGENIAAVEVESVLMRHPRIQAAAVAAVPDPIRGDEVFACLKVDQPSAGLAAELATEIAEWALDQMAYYKVPGYIAFVDALPLTATQKIERKSMKAMALRLLDDPNTIQLTHLKKRQAV